MTLQARQISKAYGVQRVLDRLTLSVDAGEVVCLLGPNGAGKTTLILTLSGLQKPDSGEVLWDGQAAGASALKLRRSIGLILHQPFLYEHLTGCENLRFYSLLYETGHSEADLRKLMGRVGLANARPIPVRGFSRGMKQRLTIARALLADDIGPLKDKRLVAIGPVTAAAMEKLGLPPVLTADEYTDQGIMEILQRSAT